MWIKIGDAIVKMSRALYNEAKRSGWLSKGAKIIKNPSRRQKNKAMDIEEYRTVSLPSSPEVSRLRVEGIKNIRKSLEKKYGDKFADYTDDQISQLIKHIGEKSLFEGSLATETALTAKAGRKALSQEAKKMNGGSRNRKRGGRVGKPKGVGAALRGYGATKRGK